MTVVCQRVSGGKVGMGIGILFWNASVNRVGQPNCGLIDL